MASVLRDFELLLMHKHRFALSDVVVCIHSILQDVQDVQKLSCQSFSRRLERLVGLVPTFLGEQELAALLQALIGYCRSEATPDALRAHTQALEAAARRNAALCRLLAEKRDHLAKFLDEAALVLRNSHSKRLAQYEKAMEQLTASFKATLEDEHLQIAKQLRFSIRTIETSMSTMLLPHFEICRTITTANAQVQTVGSVFSKGERDHIDTFVRTAARLKSGAATFRSVLQDATQFLTQLVLFERAASKDAFLVCSSALKLQFRESLDQELFLAYVEDWRAKRKAVQLTEASDEYQAATSRLHALKTAIGRAHELVQDSQKKLALDDPARASLAREVARIFHDEGGVVTQIDLPGYE
ncbi:hypothetical protein PRIC1_007750 [Phytophthora ramorum]|nr:hypothetical protein KRP22_8055 [Phytophthora ramorum]